MIPAPTLKRGGASLEQKLARGPPLSRWMPA